MTRWLRLAGGKVITALRDLAGAVWESQYGEDSHAKERYKR